MICVHLKYSLRPIGFHPTIVNLKATGCPSKNLSLEFLPYIYGIFCPCVFSAFSSVPNIFGGSYIKIKSCQVILKAFYEFLTNFDPKSIQIIQTSFFWGGELLYNPQILMKLVWCAN